ncbi:hypothetical protein GQR58_029506 [Nymphon striatum]|nr:hypothetical protein GQR58_029506 [Nymphon striatum]
MHGPLGIAHNGNLVNADHLREGLLKRGAGLSSSSDSEAWLSSSTRSATTSRANGSSWSMTPSCEARPAGRWSNSCERLAPAKCTCTEVLLPMLASDALELFAAATAGSLADVVVEMKPGYAATVVVCAEGYPGTPTKGISVPDLGPPHGCQYRRRWYQDQTQRTNGPVGRRWRRHREPRHQRRLGARSGAAVLLGHRRGSSPEPGDRRPHPAGIEHRVVDHRGSDPSVRRQADQQLIDVLSTFEPDLVVLAGWMRILGAEVGAAFPMINLHPAKPGDGTAVGHAAHDPVPHGWATDVCHCPRRLVGIPLGELDTDASRRRDRLCSDCRHVMIDDFGAGYSSLQMLSDLPIDGIKIDRSYTARIETDARVRHLVTSIAEFARSTDMIVVAEGVETAEQAEFLTRIGIDRGQGFLFSRAIDPNAFAKLLATGHLGANLASGF